MSHAPSSFTPVLWKTTWLLATSSTLLMHSDSRLPKPLPSTLANGGYLLRHEIIDPKTPSSTPPVSRSKSAEATGKRPAPTNLSDSLVPTRTTMLVSSLNVLGHAAYRFPGPTVSKLGSMFSDEVTADSDDDGIPVSGTTKTSSKTKTPDQPSPSVAPPKKAPAFPPRKLPSMTLASSISGPPTPPLFGWALVPPLR